MNCLSREICRINYPAFGYRVVGSCTSGEDALRAAHVQRPDLVLMDVRLDGTMDGISTAEELRTQMHLPVVYLTAHTDDATIERARRTEPFGYVLKPFDPRELRTVIEMALYKPPFGTPLALERGEVQGIYGSFASGSISQGCGRALRLCQSPLAQAI